MSKLTQFELSPGMQESFSKVITDEEASLFSNLVRSQPSERLAAPFNTIDTLTQPASHSLLLIGMIGGLLHTRLPGYGSKCVTMQFEFLIPVVSGDRIETVIRLTHLDPGKRLATFQTDCYNQEKNQVITGQAVMFVPI